MNSVCVFREKEINGKPFYLFTLLSQIDNSSPSSSSSSGGGENVHSLLQPRLLCPSLRYHAEHMTIEEEGHSSDVDMVTYHTTPHFPNMKLGADDQQQHVQYLLSSTHTDRYCKKPLLPLSWCNNKKANPFISHIYCDLCPNPLETLGSCYYMCLSCEKVFHKECVESPLEIKAHPSFPFLSLRLYSIPSQRSCSICENQIHEITFDMAYYCPTYKVSFHMVCALKPIPIVIDHFKRHPHPLTYFPKQASLACDVCGLIKEFIPTYVCVRCVFVVHQDCIYFPCVIKNSRHHHRISFTSSLPPGKLSCGVCRRKVDNNCGAYSCNKCHDGYFVHSRCALREDLWNGEELEEIPEEPEVIVEPFVTIAEGIILHFSHGHHLKLKISEVYDDDSCCQGCVLPIYEGNYYSCVDDQCDFILHETCANAPLKIQHQLDARSLTLKVATSDYYNTFGYFSCDACQRVSFGFVYESEENKGFRLDLRCAVVQEPFNYEGHEHPLFLALSPKEEVSAVCQICNGCRKSGKFYTSRTRKLNCIECDFIVCFECATLPYKARYKHDKHFLAFRKEAREDASDQSSGWCEACESKIVYSEEGGFYVCDEYCSTTLHVDCLIGKDPYMKHGQTTSHGFDRKIHILRNNTMSRPICHGRYCDEKRCSYRVFYTKSNLAYCSRRCAFA